MITRVFTGMALVATLTLSTMGPALGMAEDSSGWDCRTMGNHVCGSDVALALDLGSGITL